MALGEKQNILPGICDVLSLPIDCCIQFNNCCLIFPLTQLKKYNLGQVVCFLHPKLDEFNNVFRGGHGTFSFAVDVEGAPVQVTS